MNAHDDFQRLFESTYPEVLAYARRRSTSVAEADDIVAEIYLTAWRRSDAIAKLDTPLAWLYGIGLNVVRNQRRSNARHLRLVGAASEAVATKPPVADPSDGLAVREALDSLPDDDAELIRLVAWEGLSHAEASEVLGCSTNAVGVRLHRARRRLDDALSPLPSNTYSPSPSPSPQKATS